MDCPNCSSPVLPNARFCPQCGDSLLRSAIKASKHVVIPVGVGIADARDAAGAGAAHSSSTTDDRTAAAPGARPSAVLPPQPDMPVTPPVGAPRQRALWIAIASVAGLIVGLGLVIVVGLAFGLGRFGGESVQSKAAELLRPDAKVLARITGEVNAAKTLADLDRAGADAQRMVSDVRGRDVSLAGLDDPKVREESLQAHRAVATLVGAYADLRSVTRAHLDAWDTDQRTVVSEAAELDVVAPYIRGFDAKRPVQFTTAPVAQSADKVAGYLTHSAQKLARYERALARYRREHRKAIQVAEDYRSTVLAQMALYQATRTELQSYVTDSKTFFTQIDDFRTTLQEGRDKRQSIRGTIASLTPPSSVTTAQQAIVAVLDKAIDTTGVGIDLADATQRLRDEGDDYTSAFDLPEYHRFSQMSDEITHERDAAMASWTNAIGGYLHRLRNGRRAPKPPVI